MEIEEGALNVIIANNNYLSRFIEKNKERSQRYHITDKNINKLTDTVKKSAEKIHLISDSGGRLDIAIVNTERIFRKIHEIAKQFILLSIDGEIDFSKWERPDVIRTSREAKYTDMVIIIARKARGIIQNILHMKAIEKQKTADELKRLKVRMKNLNNREKILNKSYFNH